MSNWYKESQMPLPSEDIGEGKPEPDLSGGSNGGDSVRYRLMFPIDITAFSTGNPEQDQQTVYDIVRTLLDSGLKAAKGMPGFNGFSDYLQLSDIKTHQQVLGDEGFDSFGA